MICPQHFSTYHFIILCITFNYNQTPRYSPQILIFIHRKCFGSNENLWFLINFHQVTAQWVKQALPITHYMSSIWSEFRYQWKVYVKEVTLPILNNVPEETKLFSYVTCHLERLAFYLNQV